MPASDLLHLAEGSGGGGVSGGRVVQPDSTCGSAGRLAPLPCQDAVSDILTTSTAIVIGAYSASKRSGELVVNEVQLMFLGSLYDLSDALHSLLS